MITPDALRRLRNDVRIDRALALLEIPTKDQEGYLRFLCPVCSEFNTAVNPRTNLGRCFRCQRNFNPIDLVLAETDCGFLEAVVRLRPLLRG